MKTKDLSDSITVILLTYYKRYPYLLRALNYYHGLGLPCQMLVLDSSDMLLPQEQSRLIKDNARITYVRYPAATYPLDKMRRGLEEVKTPYAVLISDDDFLILSSLGSAVDFLDRYPDYSIVHGQGCLFTSNAATGSYKIGATDVYPQRSITEELASLRLLDHLKNYSTTMYSVHRTQDLAHNMEMNHAHQFGWNFQELALSCLSIIQGKAWKMNCLYMVRDGHQENGSWDEELKGRNSFDWVVREDFPRNYAQFCDCLAQHLADKDIITLQEAREIVQQAFWKYLNITLKYQYQQCYSLGVEAMRTRLKHRIIKHPLLNKSVLPAVRFMKSKFYVNQNSMALPALLSSGSPYHKDFMPIYQTMSEFKI